MLNTKLRGAHYEFTLNGKEKLAVLELFAIIRVKDVRLYNCAIFLFFLTPKKLILFQFNLLSNISSNFQLTLCYIKECFSSVAYMR